jgi:serine/threonine-protein kinase
VKESSRSDNSAASLAVALHVDQVCNQFEAAWKDRRPRIEDFLGDCQEPERSILLGELLALDLEYRRQNGEQPLPEEYHLRFPDDGALIDEVFRDEPDASPGQHGAKPGGAGESTIVLKVTEGPHRGARFEFDRHDTFVVGRASTAHLQLADDPYFSRHHFLLEFCPPRCYLRDLGSRNGTLVNGAKVKEAFLKDGDVIGGGRTRLRLSVQADKEGSERPAGSGAEHPLAATASFLENAAPTGSLAGLLDPAEGADRPQLAPGYEIVRKLGRGGMGVVYLARHQATGQFVALKVIVPESAANDRAVQLFLREVSVLSKLDHPRIVHFYEVGMARGQFFFAMEYVETVNLNELFAPEPRPRAVKALCGIFCQTLEALAYAHARSFVHRDVKPTNVLVSCANRKLRTKLADFGLAKNFEQGGFSGMTRRGDVRGSLPFMAPEQVLNCRGVRPAADIYGVGATLYFLLSHHTPHDFPPDRDPFAVIFDEEIVPLRERCPELPPGLAAIVERALARDPNQRFASAAEMRRRLLPYAKGLASR